VQTLILPGFLQLVQGYDPIHKTVMQQIFSGLGTHQVVFLTGSLLNYSVTMSSNRYLWFCQDNVAQHRKKLLSKHRQL